jgi:NAD-dependent SIR2 family protein deacetylase
MKARSDGEDSARALVELLEETPRVMGMTGAGASAASGVPTYRGAGGNSAALATPQDRRGLSVCVVTGGSIDAAKLVEILG